MKIKFARFGGLSSVNQRGYKSNTDSFHGPPCRRGFYAFVWPHYDFFLLSNGNTTLNPWNIGTKFRYVKDAKGNVINANHPDYEYFSNTGKYWSIPTKEWYFHQEKHPEYEDPEYDAKLEAHRIDWETNHGDKPKWVLVQKPSPRIFEYTGEIWHHLDYCLGPSGAIKRKGGWTLSPFEEYKKALEKDMHQAIKLQTHEYNLRKIPYSTKNPYHGVCKDHLEVFIEKL
jgi:hypothetical protein